MVSIPPSGKATGSASAAKKTPIEPFPGATVPGPSIRIGLTVRPGELRISSAGSFVLVEKTPETPRRTLAGAVQIRLERPVAEGTDIYRVQVSSLASLAAAEKLARELNDQFSTPAIVRENTSLGTNQVRLGRFPSREEAQTFASGPVAAAGYRDAFVVRETGEATAGEVTLALRGPEGLLRLSRSGYLFLPGPEPEFLQLNGIRYRGALDVTMGKDGRLMVVNQLAMEDYLLGVVPAELSPVAFPEEEALAAQAIAARTYALKNVGRNRANGFDLTDDSSNQVYGGAAIEKPMSSEAVRRTAGIAIYYAGNLIDAMYMSTCGGRTEDFANVFDTAPVPYLTGVFCTIESNASPDARGMHLAGSHDLKQIFLASDGSTANREVEMALVLDVVKADAVSPEALAATPEPDEIRQMIDKARRIAGKSDTLPPIQATDITLRAGFIRFAAERFFGPAEINRSVSDSDTSYYLSNFADGSAVPAHAKRALAYLVHRKLWQPCPDNSVKPNQAVQRGDVLALLVRWIVSARPEILRTATSADPGSTSPGASNIFALQRGNRTEQLRLAPMLRLFKITGGRSIPVDELHIIGGEKLVYHLNPAGEIDLAEIELSPAGAASDRLSAQATWQVSIPRAVASEKLRALAGNIGEIRDLKPARLGTSGRVVQVEIVGSRGSTVVNGYKVRGALGLKDTLYTLTRTTADDGSVASFNFDGRGWGHGIGLCQTGAVGMAKAGKTAEEILKTYYQGVELRKVY